jgi:hypothetical protein
VITGGGAWTRRRRSHVRAAAAALDGALLLLVLPGGREEWSSPAASSLGRSGICRGERLHRWPAATAAPALPPSTRADWSTRHDSMRLERFQVGVLAIELAAASVRLDTFASPRRSLRPCCCPLSVRGSTTGQQAGKIHEPSDGHRSG